MGPFITLSKRDEIGVIAVDNPPVNALSSALAAEMRTALHALEADPAIRAIVVIGSGRTLSGGG